MIKKRIIPKLLLNSSKMGNRLITGSSLGYSDYRVIGSPESQASIFQSTISDELMVLVKRSAEVNFESKVEALKAISNRVLMPISYGGGLCEITQVHKIFEIGVERVIFGKTISQNPKIVEQTANLYGSQAVVLSIDCEGRIPLFEPLGATTKKSKNLLSIISFAIDSGVGEICINDTTQDGKMSGSNIELLREVRTLTNLPIIQGCGFGKTRHFVEAFNNGADAIAVGTFFAFVNQNFLEIRSHIRNSGIDIRI